jgi:Tol biopolymer transport system component
VALDLKTGLTTPLIKGFHATFLAPNYILFVQGNSLMAAYFDPADLIVGHPERILEDVVIASERHAAYAISQNGTLSYLSGPSELERILVKVDRNGRTERLDDRPRPYSLLMDIEPDGQRVALTLWEDQQDVFVYDLDRGDFDRFTLNPHNDFDPLWTPDGTSLVFTSAREGNLNLHIKPSDRSLRSRPCLINEYPKWASSWSPDGELAFVQEHPENGLDVWILSDCDSKTPRLLLGEPFNENRPAFSPDGQWLAYSSDELGQPEIYVAPYPSPGTRCKVSTSGGEEPRWSADGKELFYRQDDKAMVVDVTDRDFCNAEPRVLFQGLNEQMWDVSPDGDFFITIEQPEAAQLNLVQNFHEELKHLGPSDD